MAETPDRTESIFAAAVVLPATAERVALLDRECADNAGLRGRIEALLRAHDRAGHLLDRPVPGGLGQTQAYISSEHPGAVIAGRYKLLEAIGEGGMGTVWVAEQTEPVRRKVALKLIKAGMDSRSVLARFEAERQALAVMDHPNIAKVLDGGLTETGRPFFVMEYVKGVPITEYCDATRMSVQERLNLFVQVCQAVQHAHHKGIIHRDLKPSNILVAPYDGQPVPKVIDFGLAKAMHQSLTERTLYTAHGLMVGTPLYMSPEQAEINNLDVDTRTDVYSLGVLLYELLTGSTPLVQQQFKDAAFAEILRLIKEEEPTKPSLKLSGSASLPSIAAQRGVEPAQLSRTVRGDLDWIVMKSLEKERSRRYESATALGADITRFLNNDAVQARPASTSYRLRKFVAKNRGAVASLGAIGLALLIGLGATGWALLRERATANQLRSTLKNFHRELELNILDSALGGKPDDAKALLSEAKIAGVPEESLVWLTALVALSEGRAKHCITTLENLRDSGRPLSVAAHTTLAWAYIEDGRLSDYYTALDKLHDSLPVDDADHILLGEARWLADDSGEGMELLKQGLRRRDTPVVRAMCARAMMITAAASPENTLAEKLAHDAEQHMSVAELMAGDLPLVRDYSVLVHHGAMRLHSGDERERHRICALEAAKSDAGSALGELYRAQFYEDLGDVAEARRRFIQANQKGDLNAYYLAPFLFEHSPATALDDFSKVRQPNPEGPGALGARAFLLALTPGRQREAIKLADHVTKTYRDFDTRIDALCVSLLAGDKQVAEKALELIPTSYANFHEFDKMLDHLAERCDRDGLESIARNSMGRQAHYYVIGVRLLASGDRERAKEYFQRSTATLHVATSYPLYSRALLKQLKRDPTWPNWLPAEPSHPIESGIVRPTQKSADLDAAFP